jgi:hypothetical protein
MSSPNFEIIATTPCLLGSGERANPSSEFDDDVAQFSEWLSFESCGVHLR